MRFDVLYRGLATYIGLFGVASGCAVFVGRQVAEKPPICRFFDRPALPNFFGRTRSAEKNSLDYSGLEGSADRSRGLNPLARRLAISILSRYGEVS